MRMEYFESKYENRITFLKAMLNCIVFIGAYRNAYGFGFADIVLI